MARMAAGRQAYGQGEEGEGTGREEDAGAGMARKVNAVRGSESEAEVRKEVGGGDRADTAGGAGM